MRPTPDEEAIPVASTYIDHTLDHADAGVAFAGGRRQLEADGAIRAA